MVVWLCVVVCVYHSHNSQSVEGRPAFLEAIQFLKHQAPIRHLELSAGLSYAAYDHCADLGIVRGVAVLLFVHSAIHRVGGSHRYASMMCVCVCVCVCARAQHGKHGHEGTDGSSIAERFSRHGQWGGNVAEAIFYAYDNAVDIVVAMIVGDGIPQRTDRMNRTYAVR